uniref:Uncharacterized protein n=1 Tax=Anguilla anguilla TaxID=7936 RepID=A0A0E9SYA5_ANGAN
MLQDVPLPLLGTVQLKASQT